MPRRSPGWSVSVGPTAARFAVTGTWRPGVRKRGVAAGGEGAGGCRRVCPGEVRRGVGSIRLTLTVEWSGFCAGRRRGEASTENLAAAGKVGTAICSRDNSPLVENRLRRLCIAPRLSAGYEQTDAAVSHSRKPAGVAALIRNFGVAWAFPFDSRCPRVCGRVPCPRPRANLSCREPNSVGPNNTVRRRKHELHTMPALRESRQPSGSSRLHQVDRLSVFLVQEEEPL